MAQGDAGPTHGGPCLAPADKVASGHRMSLLPHSPSPQEPGFFPLCLGGCGSRCPDNQHLSTTLRGPSCQSKKQADGNSAAPHSGPGVLPALGPPSSPWEPAPPWWPPPETCPDGTNTQNGWPKALIISLRSRTLAGTRQASCIGLACVPIFSPASSLRGVSPQGVLWWSRLRGCGFCKVPSTAGWMRGEQWTLRGPQQTARDQVPQKTEQHPVPPPRTPSW